MNLLKLDSVDNFIDKLSDEDSAKILANLSFLEMNQTQVLLIKPLSKKIRELIVKQYRIVFFKIKDTIYIVDIFKKQSRKTPKRTIKRAEEIYRNIINK